LAVNVFNFHQLEKKLILKVIPTISWIRGCYSAVVDFLIILSYDYLKCYSYCSWGKQVCIRLEYNGAVCSISCAAS